MFVLTVFSGCSDFNFKAKYARTVNMSVAVGQASELSVETGVGSITVAGADVTDCNITAEIIVKAETQEEAKKLAEQLPHGSAKCSGRFRRRNTRTFARTCSTLLRTAWT